MYKDDFLIKEDGRVDLRSDKLPAILAAKEKSKMVLLLEFISVSEYLQTLLDLSKILVDLCDNQSLVSQGIIYLCAAVSDFYIPEDQMSEHKIQSRGDDDNIFLHLKKTPKLM